MTKTRIPICPFCAGASYCHEEPGDHGLDPLSFFRCAECGARGPTVLGHGPGPSRQALQKWSTRVSASEFRIYPTGKRVALEFNLDHYMAEKGYDLAYHPYVARLDGLTNTFAVCVELPPESDDLLSLVVPMPESISFPESPAGEDT